MIEKRVHPRFGPLVIKTTFRVEGVQRDGYLTNVSVGGAFLTIDDPPALGAEVDFAALLPWRLGVLRAKGRVVWRSEESSPEEGKLAGVGLAFSEIPPESKTLLDAYLERFAELAAQIEEMQDP